MDNLRNRIDLKLVSNKIKKKNDLKGTSRPSYISQRIFDNDLVAICKNKVILMHNKPACVGMCI